MKKDCGWCDLSGICKHYVYAVMVDFKVIKKITKCRKTTDTIWREYKTIQAEKCRHYSDYRKVKK
jgi:hypothetical protein